VTLWCLGWGIIGAIVSGFGELEVSHGFLRGLLLGPVGIVIIVMEIIEGRRMGVNRRGTTTQPLFPSRPSNPRDDYA
jgi:hypothetical protein